MKPKKYSSFRIRIDYSITKRAHSPTPGVYMGVKGRDGRSSRGYRNRDNYRSRDRGRYRFVLQYDK